MKVLIVNSSYLPNIIAGAERVVQSLATALIAKGHQVVIVTTQPRGPGTVREVEGAAVYYLPVENVYRPFSGVQPGSLRKALWHVFDSHNILMGRELGHILDLERPDIVNTHNLAGFSTAAFGAVKNRKLPLVHTLHDQYLLCLRGTMFKRDKNCSRQCTECRACAVPRRSASQLVDVVMGVSRFILERHLQHGYFQSAGKHVVYNAIGHGRAVYSSPPRPPRAGFVFGFLGQIRSTKGLHRLIEAFTAECSTEAELWIAGKGDPKYESELKTLTAGQRSIRWLGFVAPAEILNAIDVLVVPSLWHDTAPLVVLEAFAHGVSVLGSSRGGIPELISPGTGWVFDPAEFGALGRALRRCLHERARLAEMGRATYEQTGRFEPNRFVNGYLDAYSEATSRARSAAVRREELG